jgi:hypothetical protein
MGSTCGSWSSAYWIGREIASLSGRRRPIPRDLGAPSHAVLEDPSPLSLRIVIPAHHHVHHHPYIQNTAAEHTANCPTDVCIDKVTGKVKPFPTLVHSRPLRNRHPLEQRHHLSPERNIQLPLRWRIDLRSERDTFCSVLLWITHTSFYAECHAACLRSSLRAPILSLHLELDNIAFYFLCRMRTPSDCLRSNLCSARCNGTTKR